MGTDKVAPAIKQLREKIAIETTCHPASTTARYKALVLTKLEEAEMFAERMSYLDNRS